MNILIWHVHGSWLNNFVQGPHTYVVPVVEGRGPDGRGRATSWDWPASVVERRPEEIADTPLDVVIVQSERELELAHQWLGDGRAGGELPLVWLEHNLPKGPVADMCHPMRDRDDLVLVHVTATNQLFWDVGSTRSCVIEHGVAVPPVRWSGEVATAGVVINEAGRRGRTVGADLIGRFAVDTPIDLFGMGALAFCDTLPRFLDVRPFDDLPQATMHEELAKRRCYLHLYRWTSLGLSLLEAMAMGMPVVSLATAGVPDALAGSGAVVSNDLTVLDAELKRLFSHCEYAALRGERMRAHVEDRFSLVRFLDSWNLLLEGICT
jgi:glycosyltransferase involved in cell wall biosynthesis